MFLKDVESWREGGGRNLPPAKDSAGEEMKPQSIESTSNSSTHASYEMTVSILTPALRSN